MSRLLYLKKGEEPPAPFELLEYAEPDGGRLHGPSTLAKLRLATLEMKVSGTDAYVPVAFHTGTELSIRRFTANSQDAPLAVRGEGVGSAGGAGGMGPDDATDTYMRELLEPLPQKPPPFSELPDFLKAPLKKKLVCMDSDYKVAAATTPQAKELLIPLSQKPTIQTLARTVSNVLNGQLRNVQGENTLHKDVDMLFVDMFELARRVGLLTFDFERNTSDTRSNTTGAGSRPDFLLWVRKALLVKGEEKKSADELSKAEDEIMNKMTSTWDDKVYGECLYMFAYAVAGYMLEIYALQDGNKLLLLSADMSTLHGKLDVLVAVVNMTRALCAMSRVLPTITWGVGQQVTVKEDNTVVSRVTNMGDFVRKELRYFEAYHSKYADLAFLRSSYAAIQGAAAAGGATHLMRAKKLPELVGEHVTIETVPVGVAYSNNSVPRDEQEAKLAIKGAVEGCGELHAMNIAHRDPRWPNIVKVTERGETRIIVIDIEKSGVLDAVCMGPPFPLPHWKYTDGSGRNVLEPNNTYSARSDFKMIGKELMARLPSNCLGAVGQDLRRRLENGDYRDAAEVLAHEWFS